MLWAMHYCLVYSPFINIKKNRRINLKSIDSMDRKEYRDYISIIDRRVLDTKKSENKINK